MTGDAPLFELINRYRAGVALWRERGSQLQIRPLSKLPEKEIWMGRLKDLQCDTFVYKPELVAGALALIDMVDKFAAMSMSCTAGGCRSVGDRRLRDAGY